MNTAALQLVHEDERLLIINKPAGLVCHPTKTDEYSSLVGRIRLYLGPGTEARLINRLDRETSGIVVVAKDRTTARDLGRIWETRQVQKTYLAIVHGNFPPTNQVIDAPLGKDIQSKVAIKDAVRADGAPAQTSVALVKSWQNTIRGQEMHFSLVTATPLSGRKHQIRIHLSHLGFPIVGDKIYGPDEDLYLALVEDRMTRQGWDRLLLPHHALAAVEVQFPWEGTKRKFSTKPEPWFREFAGST